MQEDVSPMQVCRDNFLDSILRKFPQLDLGEISEILAEFKAPFRIYLAHDSQTGAEGVQEPWSFDRLAINTIEPHVTHV